MLFETTAIKYLGGTLYLLIALGLVVRFVVPRVVPWLMGEAVRVRVRPRIRQAVPHRGCDA